MKTEKLLQLNFDEVWEILRLVYDEQFRLDDQIQSWLKGDNFHSNSDRYKYIITVSEKAAVLEKLKHKMNTFINPNKQTEKDKELCDAFNTLFEA